MGTGCSCSRSRLDQLPAVLVCRERCNFLEDALDHSYALADAHLAYMRSLRTVGPALHRFFEIYCAPAAPAANPTSPCTNSTSETDDSHIQFDSSSIDEGDPVPGRDSTLDLDSGFPVRNYFGTNIDTDDVDRKYSGEVIRIPETPPPPPPTSRACWDYYFDLFDGNYDEFSTVKEKEEDESRSSEGSCSEKESAQRSSERSDCEAWKELEGWFQKASESGVEVVKMLDTGKFRYHPRTQGGYWKMFEGSQEEVEGPPQNLSSIMRKLCMWEHKLLYQVRGEEKLRVLHAKKWKQMGGHDYESGSLRALSSKIKVALHVIDKTFLTINNLTAEELWPHINQLVHRFSGMWQLMIEIHQHQHQVVKGFSGPKEASGIDHLQVAAAELEHELQNWILNFSNWIKAQRACIKSLNAWLRLNIYEPAEDVDCEATCRAVPLVFLIIRQWSSAMDRLSEEEVVAALNAFSETINGLQLDQQMRQTAHDKDTERKLNNLKREGQKVQFLGPPNVNKMKTALAREVGQDLTYKVPNASPVSCLEQVFIAMEKLATDWKQAYEAIGKCTGNEPAAQEFLGGSGVSSSIPAALANYR